MTAPTGEIQIGTVVAETYEVTRLLGQGGMGAVWEATHRRLPGKRVAIKVLLNASKDAEQLARFRREAEIASRLGHPNIIEVIDFHETPSGTPYMILEFLPGESLAGRLRKGPVPMEKLLDIIRQVGSALHAAHREQIVHRDLKPDNIFLCPSDMGGVVSDRVKVLDFGISKIRGSQTVQTQESALLGTPQYMSPEQAFGRNKTIDQRTDVWALGAIVYEMLAGKPAFNGETLAQVILSIVHEDAPTLRGQPGVPDHVADAVDGALQKDPDKRFNQVADFIAKLTGKPLQTLDRPVAKPIDAFASTAAGVPTPDLGRASTQAQGATPVSVSTQPRGELQAVVPPTHQVTGVGGGGSKTGMLMGVGVVVIGLAVGATVFVMKKPATVQVPDPVPAANAAKVDVPKPPDPVPVAKAPESVKPPDPVKPADAVKPAIEAGSKPPKGEKPESKPKSDGALPPEVAADLDAAEKSLASGDHAQALHLARRTLTVKKSARAYALITRAYCKAGDLGNARANVTHTGGERAAVVKACKKLDVDLTP